MARKARMLGNTNKMELTPTLVDKSSSFPTKQRQRHGLITSAYGQEGIKESRASM